MKGTKYNRLYFQLAPSMHRTDGTEFGLLPTVTCMDQTQATANMKTTQVKTGSMHSVTLTRALTMDMLPTPRCFDAAAARKLTMRNGKAENLLYTTGRKYGLTLAQSVNIKMWPTPVASDATTGTIIGKNDTYKQTSGLPRKINQNGTDGSVGLGRLVKLIPTQTVRDFNGTNSMEHLTRDTGHGNHKDQLPNFLKLQIGDNFQLNPLFVEEMMGFPEHWIALPFLNGEKKQ